MKKKKIGYLFMVTAFTPMFLMINSTAKASDYSLEMPLYYDAASEEITPYTKEEYEKFVENISSKQNNPDTSQLSEKIDESNIEMPLYYDANGEEITPYTKEEYSDKVNSILNNSQQNNEISLFSVANPNYYDTFGYGEFKNFVWINQGKLYKNPIYVNVERYNRSSGLAIYFYDSNDVYYGKAVFRDYGTLWHVAEVDHLPRGKSYKFKLVSESGEVAQVKQGNIAYDN